MGTMLFGRISKLQRSHFRGPHGLGEYLHERRETSVLSRMWLGFRRFRRWAEKERAAGTLGLLHPLLGFASGREIFQNRVGDISECLRDFPRLVNELAKLVPYLRRFDILGLRVWGPSCATAAF